MQRIITNLLLFTFCVCFSTLLKAYDPLAPGEPIIYINTGAATSVNFVDLPLFNAEVWVGSFQLHSNQDGGPHTLVEVTDGILGIESTTEGAHLLQVVWMDSGFPTILDINIIVDNSMSPTTSFKQGLPVEFSKFEVTQSRNNVVLNWQTLSEVNADYFAVERSTNGRTFEEIAQVAATGNSNAEKNYSFEDRAVDSKTYYYRLKQIDIDGQFIYTKTQSIKLNPSKSPRLIPITVLPNQIKIHLTDEMVGQVEILIFDISGRTLISNFSHSQENTREVDTSNLPKGKYIASVLYDNRLLSGIFLKY